MPRLVIMKQRGFSLIELLVSASIVGLGIVSMLNLQYKALADTRMSDQIVAALLSAEAMAERIYANPIAAEAGQYEHKKPPKGAIPDCLNQTCSIDELAKFDIHEWQTNLPKSLENVSGQVKKASKNGKVWTVIVRWDADSSGSKGKKCPKTKSNHLDCVSLDVSIN